MKRLILAPTRVSALLASRGPDLLGRPARYFLALGLIVLFTALRLLIAPQEAGLPYVAYFPAATLAAIFGGLEAAALATMLGTLTAWYLFIPPHNSFELTREVWTSALLFVLDEVIVCTAIEALRHYYRKSMNTNAKLALAHAAEQAARLAAERANEAKSRFLAAASHDLRQPYQALRLFHSALQNEHLSAEIRTSILAKMELAMNSGEELLTSLLDLSTLDAGVVTPKWANVDVVEVLSALDACHRGRAEGKGLSFRVHSITAELRTDPVLLRRILDNLVTNAIRYTASGAILVAARRSNNAIAFEVWDTGIGIAREHQKMVFEEFYQIRNPERDRTKGSGLGLAVACKAAKLIGCRLDLRSHLGRGTRMRLLVPAG